MDSDEGYEIYVNPLAQGGLGVTRRRLLDEVHAFAVDGWTAGASFDCGSSRCKRLDLYYLAV